MQVEARKYSCFFAAEHSTTSSYSYKVFFASMAFPTLYCNWFILPLRFHVAFPFAISIKIGKLGGEEQGKGNGHKTQISNTVRFGRF